MPDEVNTVVAPPSIADAVTADYPPDPVEISTPERPKPEVFKEHPDFDSRTLVLKLEDKVLDLQFCGCVNKYKKRFSQFLTENPSLYTDVKENAIALAEKGYADLDAKEILEYLRTSAKKVTAAAEYLKEHPHDFELDSLPRAYLIRKLMMEESKLFGKFTLAPVTCRANCGYPKEEEPTAEAASTDIAGF